MSSLDAGLAQVNERVSDVNARVGLVDDRVELVREQIVLHRQLTFERAQNTNRRFSGLDTQVGDLGNSLSNLETELMELGSSVSAVDERVSLLRQEVGNVTVTRVLSGATEELVRSLVGEVESDVEQIRSDVVQVRSDVGRNSRNVQTLTTNVNRNTRNIQTLTTSGSRNSGSLQSLTTNVNLNTRKISGRCLQSAVSTSFTPKSFANNEPQGSVLLQFNNRVYGALDCTMEPLVLCFCILQRKTDSLKLEEAQTRKSNLVSFIRFLCLLRYADFGSVAFFVTTYTSEAHREIRPGQTLKFNNVRFSIGGG